MIRTIALAAMAAALAPAAALAETPSSTQQIDVAFDALAEGRTAEAVTRLQQSGGAEAGDPAVLINLGTAYARQGRIAEARAMFEAAAKSGDRYDLELADGSWVDSRKAAKMALANLDQSAGTATR